MFMEQPFDKITKVFKDKDKGNRGVITEQQLRRVMIQIGQDATEFDDLVAGFKGGREGQEVNYEDFVKWLLDDAVVNSHPRERVVDIFQSFDPSNTGRVSASCLYAVLKGIEKCQGEADQMFEETQRSCSAVVGDQVDYRTWLDWLFSDMPARSPFAYFAHPRSDTLTVERAIDPTTEAEPIYVSMDEFREKHAGDRGVLEQMRSSVLVCQCCAKPNAYTMKECNGCGTSLEGVVETFTDNIFMGFIYGVAKGRFPYSISIRKESEDYLAFDDPLGVTVVHMCVIPTTTFCSDIRFLFADPARGLELVDNLMEFGRQAVMDQYWSNREFRETYWPNHEPPSTVGELQDMVILGFNFPPSVFQLHLQFMHLPCFPFHEVQARKGNHWHFGRFFPFEYIRKALACGDNVRMDVDIDTSIEDVISNIAAQGIPYEAEHASMMGKFERSSKRFDVWRADDFEYEVCEGVVTSTRTGHQVPDANPVDIQKQDNARMKNYGRPRCSYYRYIKQAGSVKSFPLL